MNTFTASKFGLLLACFAAACSPISVSLAQEPASSVSLLQAADAFENGQGAWGVKLDHDGAAVLYDRVLVEDEGPAIGSDAYWLQTQRAPTTTITGDTWIKKVLHLDRAGAMQAHLYVPEGVTIEINGQPLSYPTGSPYAEVPPSILKAGDNEVALHYSGKEPRTIKSALPEDILRNAPERRDRPPRSFKSMDGGRSWSAIQGEYMVRLHLVQFVPQGKFISPVIDLGRQGSANAGDTNPLLQPVVVQSVSLEAQTETPDGTHVAFEIRTGRAPVYDPASWTDWISPSAPVPGENRYAQWRAALASNDPLKTPRVLGVSVRATLQRPPAPPWTEQLRVVSFHNDVIRSTSMPFEYENPLHPRLAALRRDYKLDELVAGAPTETEKLVRVRDWVAHQWKFKAPETYYPPWDANEILEHRCGFCVQYAIVMMQCAISLGYQARFVFGHNPGAYDGGGHEVCEIWSNEHRKWMFFDVNQNWFYMNPRAREPLSMLEVHDLIRKTYYANGLSTPEIAVCYGTNMVPSPPPAGFEQHFTNGSYTVPTRWLFVNYVPRNNFLAQPYPQPKTQGTHWDWSEYWRWEDGTTPKQWQYRNFTDRRSDVAWTINQVRFDATPQPEPNELSVRMGTFTPFFKTFQIKADQTPWQDSPAKFAWHLHPGLNRLEMRTRNTSDVTGPPSFVEIECGPSPK
jgi:transglutaminase-like putative cysteine protease